jgi:hypothetical protein
MFKGGSATVESKTLAFGFLFYKGVATHRLGICSYWYFLEVYGHEKNDILCRLASYFIAGRVQRFRRE